MFACGFGNGWFSGEIAGVPYGCTSQFGPRLGFVVSAGDSGNPVHYPQEKPVMKTNRSMIRTLGLLALSLLATATVHEAHADAMRPSYRIEDLGLVSKWGGINPRFSPDGTVHRYDQVPGSRFNVGEYHVEFEFERERAVKVLLLKGYNSTNLFTEEQSRFFAGRVKDITADGKILLNDVPISTDFSIYDVNTGQKTLVKSSSEIGDPETHAQVFAINAFGQMVGQQDSKAILYDSFDATPILLKALVEGAGNWRFSEASDISDTGDIIVRAYADGEPDYYAFKLVPITQVPEPSMIFIFSALSFGVFMRSRHLMYKQSA
jgi:hypothetical protein